jgi:DNA polymerase I-like protein with 3'-5' exonuclease and polymerase domains
MVLKESGASMVHNNQRGESNLWGTVEEGLRYLMSSTLPIVAHNGIKFDIPALKKVYPWFDIEESRLVDTLVMSRLMFTNLFDTDPKLIQMGKLAPKNIGRHSLEAWGQRVGIHKIGYEGGFEAWSQEMEDYCVGDVETLEAVHKHFLSINYSEQALRLEHQVANIIARQERRGFTFDVNGAADLYATLSKERMVIERNLRETFKPFYLRDGKEFIPKADNKRLGYVKDAPVTKLKLTEFNPGSRDHISGRLKVLRGWRPDEFTADGKPKVDDLVLNQLPYPEAKLLATYMMLNKRIGQIAEGEQAWLKLQRNGIIHGGVITNGAVTGRMTHSNPNLAQVPAIYSPWGAECRALFKPRKGYVLVGADASALELRCLAGYMAAFDGGDYITVVVSGRKEDGTEIHTVNRKALGIESRDVAKTWIYAYLYGAGDEKLGTVLGYPKGDKARKAGKESRAKFLEAIPAMAKLVDRVKAKVEPSTTKWIDGRKVTTKNKGYVGYLKGLDGRQLHVRSSHAALNTLLQSAGAIIMKQALVCLESLLKETLVPGVDYEFVANVHDEFQIEVLPQHAEYVGQCCVKALQLAGEHFNFACPITGEYVIGNSWKETH